MNDKNTKTLKDTYGVAYNNYKKGDLKAAEILCYKILNINPNYLETKILLANISAKKKNYIQAKQLLNEAADKLFEQLKYGKVKIEIFKKYKLQEIVQAHTDLESRKIIGPSIIIP